MLDVGWSEIIVIAVVMIVIVGPKDLPKMLRAFGKATARMRSTANDFKRQFDDALKEAELDDVKNIIDETRKLDPRKKMTQVFDPIRSAGNDLKASLNQSPKPEQPAKPVEAAISKDNTAEEGEAELAKPETKTPADAIAEAVKKNLPETAKPEVAEPVTAKPAPKARTTAKAATPAKKTTAKSGTKPAAKTPAKSTTKATTAKVKTAAAKPVAAAKAAPKKAPGKKPDAKPTGTNE